MTAPRDADATAFLDLLRPVYVDDHAFNAIGEVEPGDALPEWDDAKGERAYGVAASPDWARAVSPWGCWVRPHGTRSSS